MGVLFGSTMRPSGSLLSTEGDKMSDGRVRSRTLISAMVLMALLVSAMPSALAYSPAWDAMTPMIEGKSQAVVVADNANDTVYIIGGGIGVAGSQFAAASDTVVRYNVKTGVSSYAAIMPQGVRGACGGLGEDGKIYVFSGFNSTNLDVTQIYDIASDSWSAGPTVPSVVFKGDCAVVWPEFYVFGWSGPDDQVQIFSAANDTWYLGASLPDARQSGAAVYNEMENALYFMGGKNGGDVPQDTVYRLAIGSSIWTTEQPLPDQLMAFDATVGADGLIYAVGGTDNDFPYALNVYSAGYYYCPNNGTWYSLPDLDQARKYLGAVSLLGGEILAVGGNDDTTILDDVESLSLVDATSSLTPASVGQGSSTTLALNFDSYASQTGADLSYYMKSDHGTVFPVQSYQFAISGIPSIVIDIPQSMPADNYTLYLDWALIFETGTCVLPEETVRLQIVQTVPLPNQISNLETELDNQLDKIMSLKHQNDELSQQLSDLQDLLNQTNTDLDNAVDQLDDKTDDAISAANYASTLAMVGVVLALIVIVVVVINMIMSRRK